MSELEIQIYCDRAGDKYVLFGVANLIENGKRVDVLLLYHPENQPNILYAMKSKEFNKMFKRWKEKQK